MKISLLIQREPFDKIFEDTLASFLSEQYNARYKVKWHHGKQEIEHKNNQIWYCNPLINSIFIKGASSHIFDSIIGEYVFNPIKPWKNFFQKTFFNLSTSKYFAKSFAKNFVEISPSINNAKNILIIGGNNKIRLIDYKNKLVYVILKSGFNKKFIEREILIREKYKYMPIPKYQIVNHEKNWYSEEYICGTGVDRISKQLRKTALNEVIFFMNKMIKDSIVELPLSKYLNEITLRIKNNLKNISFSNPYTSKEITSIINQLSGSLYNSNKKILLCQSHGDFQEGNIIFDGEKNWILDWEYSRTRQVCYDLLVLLLKPRGIDNYNYQFSKLKNSIISDDQKWIIDNWHKKDSIIIDDSSLLLFLIEELDFFIEQNNNKYFNKTYPDEKKFIRQIKKIVDSI